MRKIAIIGMNPDLMPGVPWDDPTWEKWFLPWGPKKYVLQSAALFEMHDPADYHKYAPEGYEDDLAYWRSRGIEVIDQTNFPLARAIELGGDYFTHSLSYMVAKACLELPYAIGIFGSSPTGERMDEKANLEYWLGIARNSCIELTVQGGSTLCQYAPDGHYPVRYGWTNEIMVCSI